MNPHVLRTLFIALSVLASLREKMDFENLVGPPDKSLRFEEVALETGTADLSFGRGSAFVDLDADGRLDLVAGSADSSFNIYRQRQDHTFENMNSSWGVNLDGVAMWGVLAADFDNDGDSDLLLIVGGFEPADHNVMLRNDLNIGGGLVDISASANLTGTVKSDFGCTALDYNNDGLLDFFTCAAGEGASCSFFRNDGNMHFTEISSQLGISEQGNFRHCTSGDFDNDGWVDIAVGRVDGNCLLYRNSQGTEFEEVAALAGASGSSNHFGFVLEDFNNDGWLDAYQPKYQLSPTEPSGLLLNNQDGTFRDISDLSGMTGQTDMGHSTGDLDNDGYPEIFVGTGSPAVPFLDKLFRVLPSPQGDVFAFDYSKATGILEAGPNRLHGMALGDYDQDGDIDIYGATGGPHRLVNTEEVNVFWRNAGNDHFWAQCSLQGVLSNRTAVGARLCATTVEGREVHRNLRVGHGFANTDSPIQHFGLGEDRGLSKLVVTWPSGIVQSLQAPAMRTQLELVETGLLLGHDGTPASVLTVCGRPGAMVELWSDVSLLREPMPDVWGFQRLTGARTLAGSLQLGQSGRASLDVSSFAGQYLQALVHDPSGNSSTLTNAVAP